MLEMKLFCFEGIQGPHYRLRGTIAVVTGGRLVTYATELFDHKGELFAQGTLRKHPRWSERLEGVVARCIATALEDRVPPRWFNYEHLTLSVEVNGYLTICDLNCGGEVDLALDRQCRPALFDGTKPPNVWEVVGLACASIAWDELRVPEMPEPIQVAVHERDGVRYCLSRDLPDEARTIFERYAFGQIRPEIDGAPDAVFEADMDHFLGIEEGSRP